MKPSKGKNAKRPRGRVVNNSKNKHHNLYNKNNITVSLNTNPSVVPNNATGHLQRSQTLFQPTPLDTSYVIPQQPTYNNNYLQQRLVEQANLHRQPVNPAISSNDIASVPSGDNSKDILLPDEIESIPQIKPPRKDRPRNPYPDEDEKDEINVPRPISRRGSVNPHTREQLANLNAKDVRALIESENFPVRFGISPTSINSATKAQLIDFYLKQVNARKNKYTT